MVCELNKSKWLLFVVDAGFTAEGFVAWEIVFFCFLTVLLLRDYQLVRYFSSESRIGRDALKSATA